MDQMIEVSHEGGAWWVRAQGWSEPTLFRSGGRAEQAARRLAFCLAELGWDARVNVHDKHNALIGAFHYFGADR